MNRESPLSSFRAVRELQYAWAFYFISLQWSILGDPKTGIRLEIQKGKLQDSFDSLRRKFFGRLLERPRFVGRTIDITPPMGEEAKERRSKISRLEFPQGVVYREDLEKEDQDIFDFLATDWNAVYMKERNKATILGYVAEYMLGKGEDPEELKELSLPEFSEKAKTYKLPSLDDIDSLMETLHLTKEQTYALLYSQSKGAEWLAIYNEKGERSGKAYELLTKMYREQISEAIARNSTEGEIRSLMISPDSDEIKEALGLFEEGLSEQDRTKREIEYESLVRNHLNRDMQRFAYTECSINFNNGKLLYYLNESDKPSYVRYEGGNFSRPGSPVTCEHCLKFKNQIARVFESEDQIKDTKYMNSLGLEFLGEDQFSGDNHTTTAVWPGKSNANRPSSEWWLVCPLHPNCGCNYADILTKNSNTSISEIESRFEESRKKDSEIFSRINKKYEADLEANREATRLSKKYGRVKKSIPILKGVWEEKTCDCESRESIPWIREYIDWRLWRGNWGKNFKK